MNGQEIADCCMPACSSCPFGAAPLFPTRRLFTACSAAIGVEAAMKLLEGRWKLVILFHLFGCKVLRYSDLERLIPNITQKMLGQQLRHMEADGIVIRTVYPQVPPKVEYSLTAWGQALCPALDAILKWAELRPKPRTKKMTRAAPTEVQSKPRS